MKSISSYLVLIACLSAALPARACLNEIGTNHRGEQIRYPIDHGGETLKPYLVTSGVKSELIAWSRIVVETAKDRPSFKSLNNLAAALIRLGRLPEAVSLLQFLEHKYPGHFETASNIGTAYELMGKNEDALTWILEGIKRNPNDHYGTEWLHAHILKAKLGHLPKPAQGRSIMNLDFGNNLTPRRPAGLPAGMSGERLTLFNMAQALRYQLIERIEFVPAPDTMVAGLLLDWANLELLAGTAETAGVLYDAALRYGSTERRIITIRKNQVAKILAQSKTNLIPVYGRCELCEPSAEDIDEK